MKIRSRKFLWGLIRFVGLLPFILCLLCGLQAAFNGISFLWSPADYGLAGFATAVLFWSYVYWPTYLIGLALIVFASVKIYLLKIDQSAADTDQ